MSALQLDLALEQPANAGCGAASGSAVACQPGHVLVKYETDAGWTWGCKTCADNIRRQYAKNLGWKRTLNQLRSIRKYKRLLDEQADEYEKQND